MKSCDFTLFWLRGKDLQWHCIATPQTDKQRRVPPAASQDSTRRSRVICFRERKHICPWTDFQTFPSVNAKKMKSCDFTLFWLRGKDLNLRPSGYEPDELPSCSTPRYVAILQHVQIYVNMFLSKN